MYWNSGASHGALLFQSYLVKKTLTGVQKERTAMKAKIARKVGAVFYYALAQHLPPSYSGIQLGQKALRGACGKLMLKHCGKHVNIEQGARFSPRVSLGDYSGIGVHAKIYGTCTIGKYVMMGEECTIITRNHAYARTDIPMMEQGFETERPVVIEDDVWIGDRVTIMPGVHVGTGAIIGAGSVVTRDVEPYAIVAGVPARKIKSRKQES